jgi:putative transcriptional regulator
VKPTHHLDYSTLMAYAAGTLDEAFAVVAASHISACPVCREALLEAEAVGGALLEQMPEDQVSGDCRSRTLAALEAAPAAPARRAAPRRSAIPKPLARLIGASDFNDIAWKTRAPGVAMFDIKLPAGAKGQLRLLRIGAGRAMPEHGHGGEEITLVLKGAYRDHIGRFAAGDVADLDEEIEHKPVVEGDQDCICLVATERPTRFKTLAARLMQPFVGI